MAIILKDPGGLEWDAKQVNPYDAALLAAAGVEKSVLDVQKQFNAQKTLNIAQEQDARNYEMKVAEFNADNTYRTNMMNNAAAEKIASRDYMAETRRLGHELGMAKIEAAGTKKSAAMIKLEREQVEKARTKSIGLEAGQFAGYTSLPQLQEAFAYASENTIEGDTPEALESQRIKEVMASAITQHKIMDVNSLLQTPVNKVETQVANAVTEASKPNPDTTKIQTITDDLLKKIPKERKAKLTDDPEIARANILKYGHEIGIDMTNQTMHTRHGKRIDVNKFTNTKDPAELAKDIYDRVEEKMRKTAKKAGKKILSFTEKTKLANIKKELDWLTNKDLTDPNVAAALRKITD